MTPLRIPCFTIVMATLNAGGLVSATIESLLAQSVESWELWVIDGASADETASKAAAFGDPRIHVISEPDTGIADAWNKGVRRSIGEWLIFLGAGDTLPANALHRIQKVAPESVNPAVIYGDTAFHSSSGQFEVLYGRPIGQKGPRLGFPFLHPSCATSRSTFDHVGLFDEEVRIAIDSDFLLRAWCAGVNFIKADHTAVMLAGGVSDRGWLAANLEYAAVYSRQTGAPPFARQGARLGVHLRHLVFRVCGLGPAIKSTRRTLIFALVGVVNVLLRWLPTFRLRHSLLRWTGCQIHRTAAIHRGVRLFSLGRIRVGANSTVNRGVYLDNRLPIEIGSNVSLAHDARLYTLGHDIHDPFFKLRGGKIVLEDRVCIFAAAIILPRVTVGEAAVVYPGTVVTSDLPARSIARSVSHVELGVRTSDLRYQLDNRSWLSS